MTNTVALQGPGGRGGAGQLQGSAAFPQTQLLLGKRVEEAVVDRNLPLERTRAPLRPAACTPPAGPRACRCGRWSPLHPPPRAPAGGTGGSWLRGRSPLPLADSSGASPVCLAKNMTNSGAQQDAGVRSLCLKVRQSEVSVRKKRTIPTRGAQVSWARIPASGDPCGMQPGLGMSGRILSASRSNEGWIPVPRLRGDKLRGNDGLKVGHYRRFDAVDAVG